MSVIIKCPRYFYSFTYATECILCWVDVRHCERPKKEETRQRSKLFPSPIGWDGKERFLRLAFSSLGEEQLAYYLFAVAAYIAQQNTLAYCRGIQPLYFCMHCICMSKIVPRPYERGSSPDSRTEGKSSLCWVYEVKRHRHAPALPEMQIGMKYHRFCSVCVCSLWPKDSALTGAEATSEREGLTPRTVILLAEMKKIVISFAWAPDLHTWHNGNGIRPKLAENKIIK